jgi:hypothetical protein
LIKFLFHFFFFVFFFFFDCFVHRFYFSDSNSKDRWLRSKLKEDPEEYLPLATLLNFNRVKEICSDMAVLVDVCQESSSLQLSEDKTRVRRLAPWPEQDTSRSRSVFVRFVPITASLDELLAFFGKLGPVNAVRFRRNDEKQRLDSLFVEFASEDAAAKVVELKEIEYAPGVTMKIGASLLGQEGEQKNKKTKPAAQQKRADAPKLFEQGSVVRFKAIGTGLSRQALKEVFEQYFFFFFFVCF